MDPNHWPGFAWMVIAIGFGSIVCALALFVFKAIFRRKQGWLWMLRFLAYQELSWVAAMMACLSLSGARIPKELHKLGGYFVLSAVGLPMVWASRQILRRRTGPQIKTKTRICKG
jgi:hypothetical protein